MALWMRVALFSIFNAPKVASFFSTSKCTETMADGRLSTDCRNHGLVNMFDLHLDTATRILDMSNNEFMRLRRNEFKEAGLTSLEEISFHNNRIDRVDNYAFNGLHMLQSLDLSKNNIQTLELAFVPPLRMLNLSVNLLSAEFTTISCTTLQVLDVSFCDLQELPIRNYHSLPNLQHLNLSFNSIHKLPLPVLQQMPLKSIQIHRNPLTCGEETQNLNRWFERNNVQFSPFCFHQPEPSYPGDNTQPDPVQTRIIPASDAVQFSRVQLNPDQCYIQLQSFRREQRLFGIIALIIHAAVLVLVAVFFSLFLFLRCRDRKVERDRINPDLEEEIPPPPYRTYVSGFSI